MPKENYYTIDDLRHTAVMRQVMTRAKADKLTFVELMDIFAEKNIKPSRVPRKRSRV